MGQARVNAVRLGRFQTEALLGQGPATETYRARLADDKADERRFVITLLRDEVGASAPGFVAAARQLAGLDLAGCVRVLELGASPGPIYAVHDFKAGVNWAQLRQQAAPGGSMDARLIGLLARKLAERLAALHARTQGPRVHAGLHPGNVLVTPDGEVLLLDCGLAEAVRPRGDAFVGKWLFASPEQLAGGEATPASDLYAVGALIHFLHTGKPPFVASSVAALAERIAAGPQPVPGMPSWLSAVMVRLLASDASQRPKLASDLARQISAAMLAAETGQISEPVAPPPTGDFGEDQILEVDFGPGPTGFPGMPVSASAAERPERETETAAEEPLVPFALDEIPTEDERPRVLRDRGLAKPPVIPFALPVPSKSQVPQNEMPESRGPELSADDPDVGVVYDDDDEDEQEQLVAGKDGRVARRRRRRFSLPTWVRSELARRMSRLALIPLVGLILVALAAGVFFYREWSATRQASARRNAELAAEAQKRDLARQIPKPAETATLPAGHLMVKTTPAGATVWVDGVQKEPTPTTVMTRPGSHRLVVTLPGYRMLRDVVETGKGALWEREMFAAPRLEDGSVPVSITCQSESKYPVFVDGKDLGQLCPVDELKLDPGRHSIGVFVIPQNRIWAFDREILPNRPHRVQFNY